jgi:quercetin dioxygenase-like cupin family protein
MQIGHGPPFVRESLFGGCGRVLVWNLLGRRVAPPFTAVLSCVLEESGRVGRHVQDEYDEIVVGLTGYGEARVDGKPQPFGPGAVVYLPLGSALELVNEAPDKELRYLIIKAEHRERAEDATEVGLAEVELDASEVDEVEGESRPSESGDGADGDAGVPEVERQPAVSGEIEINGEPEGVS